MTFITGFVSLPSRGLVRKLQACAFRAQKISELLVNQYDVKKSLYGPKESPTSKYNTPTFHHPPFFLQNIEMFMFVTLNLAQKFTINEMKLNLALQSRDH